MRNPWLILPSPTRNFYKQPITDRNPPVVFLRILTPQDTPHYFSHATKTAFKTHPIEKYWFCIPAHPRKRLDYITMHWNSGEISLSMPYLFWHYAHTRRINHHQWVRNRSWEWSTHGNLIGSDRPPINAQTLTSWIGLPTCFRPSITSEHTSGGNQRKGILNGWMYWQHNHPHHWRPNLGGTRQKCDIIGDPHYITSTSDLRTAKSGLPPLTP